MIYRKKQYVGNVEEKLSTDIIYGEGKRTQTEINDNILDQFPTATITTTNGIASVNDSSNLPLKDIQVLGNATQDDTPTPPTPQDIHVVTGDNTVKVLGKNFISFKNTSSTTGAQITFTPNNSEFTLNGTSNGSGTVLAISSLGIFLPAGTYTMTYNHTSGTYTAGNNAFNFTLKDPDNNNLVQKSAALIGTQVSSTFTISKPTELYYSIYCGGANHSFSNYTLKVQIELGSTATAYEPYQEQSVTLPLGDIELAKIGTYTDRIYKSSGKWYLHKDTYKRTFTGQENFVNQASFNTDNRMLFSIEFNSTIIPNLKGSRACISNYFAEATNAQSSAEVTGVCFNQASVYSRYFYVKIDRSLLATEDATGFKNWLKDKYDNGVPVIAIFQDRFDTDTEITDTSLITALEQVLAMTTYKNTTNAFTLTVSDNATPTLVMEYRQDIGTYIHRLETLEARVTLLEQ